MHFTLKMNRKWLRLFGYFSVYRVQLKTRPLTKTTISQNSMHILLRNFVQLFSRVDCSTTTHFIIFLKICTVYRCRTFT